MAPACTAFACLLHAACSDDRAMKNCNPRLVMPPTPQVHSQSTLDTSPHITPHHPTPRHTTRQAMLDADLNHTISFDEFLGGVRSTASALDDMTR